MRSHKEDNPRKLNRIRTFANDEEVATFAASTDMASIQEDDKEESSQAETHEDVRMKA